VGVNKDDLVVLVDAILVDPVQVQDAQVIALLAHPTPLRTASSVFRLEASCWNAEPKN
jgi:hypothetical protein